MNIDINIKLNEEVLLNSLIKMEQVQVDYYTMYVQYEMSKGTSEFHSTIKFLMDENVPQKYKDLYRKKQNQVVEAMDLDDYPDPPKLKHSNKISTKYY
jgi:hypothetical protein